MDLQHPPESFGVFKPVGCVVVTLRSSEHAQAFSAALLQAGFVNDELLPYSPADMLGMVDAEALNASVWTHFEQELLVAKAHRMLAARGCSFLVVRVPNEQKLALVRGWVQHLQAPTAQLYGPRMIEELTASSASEVLFDNVPANAAARPLWGAGARGAAGTGASSFKALR